MCAYQFSHQPFQLPTEENYSAVANAFVSEIAPSLPDSVRSRITELTAAAMFRAQPTSAATIMADPALSLCQNWLWPEANVAHPFSLEHCDHWVHGWSLWRSDQWIAKGDAERRTKEATETSIEDWLYNVPMALVRQWRDKLLPDRAKRGRKYDLLFELKRQPGFRDVVTQAYEAWQQALLDEAKDLMAVANKSPVPTHLSWLVKQVLRYLDNYHTANNSLHGPGAFAARRQELIDAATSGAAPLDERALQQELEDAFAFVENSEWPFDYTRTVQLAWGYIETLRSRATPTGIARALDRYAPGKLICARPCARCIANLTKKRRAVAPFDVLCTCDKFIWVPKSFNGSEHDWNFGQRLELEASSWALDRLLGINRAAIDRSGFLIRASTPRYDAEEFHSLQTLLSAGKKKSEQFRRQVERRAIAE